MNDDVVIPDRIELVCCRGCLPVQTARARAALDVLGDPDANPADLEVAYSELVEAAGHLRHPRA
jgi:hypothetical protein